MTLGVTDACTVSALLLQPGGAKSGLVLAHGAGAGMHHPFLQALAEGLAARQIATLRYQFPFMECGSRRPDAPALAHATVRAAVAAAQHRMPGIPWFAGGKSFGGRMTTQAAVGGRLPGVRGIALFGFPLHPPRAPSLKRGEHLARVDLPMLFLQGTRDALADLELIRTLIRDLRDDATLHVVTGADHAFHVPVRSGRTDSEAREDMLDAYATWAAFRTAPAHHG